MVNRNISPADEEFSHEYSAKAVKRISWGAIFAGAFIVLAVQVTLALIGLGVSLGRVNLASGTAPDPGFGTGSAIWLVISGIISLFVGGWFAGRFAGIPSRLTGALHGMVSWALASVMMFFLLTTTVGSLAGGAFGALGNALSGNAQVLSRLMPGVNMNMPQQPAANQPQISEREARIYADQAANAASIAAWGAFIMMILGAGAAAAGGAAGTPFDRGARMYYPSERGTVYERPPVEEPRDIGTPTPR